MQRDTSLSRNTNGSTGSKGSSLFSNPSSITSPPSIDSLSYVQSRSNSPPHRTLSTRHRHSTSITSGDLADPRRSNSLRSVTAPIRSHHKAQSPSVATFNDLFPEHRRQRTSQVPKPLFSFSSIAKRQKSSERAKDYSLFSGRESPRPSTAATMASTSSYKQGRPPPNASSSLPNPNYSNGGGIGNPSAPTVSSSGSLTPQVTYQTILDTSSKRISTLDYLRKAHEGRVYWFNTLLFTKPDLLKLPYFAPPKLARRATNYLLLGYSLPTILDLNSQTATDYLKALNALLAEFEQYQSMHPPDGSSSGSLGRGRIPQMFKRATTVGSGSGKGRRTSSAADSLAALGAGLGAAPDPMPLAASSASILSGTTAVSSSTTSTLVQSERPETSLPTENYQHLMTPNLPFDPDFFETFATLCDVLIDCYTKVTQLVGGPEHCVPGVGELFQKADARVRKIVVQGVVREFEGTCREGVRGEVKGVGRVVLGGLM